MKKTRLLRYTMVAAMGLSLAGPAAQAAQENTDTQPAPRRGLWDQGSRSSDRSSTRTIRTNSVTRSDTARTTTRGANSGTLSQVERDDRLVGMTIQGSDRENIGKIKNLAVDLESGRVLYVIVDAGNKNVAVAPEVFTNVRGNTAMVNVDKAKITSAPELKSEYRIRENLAQASFVHQIYTHFGQNPWWQGSVPADQGKFNNVHLVTDLPNMPVKNVSNQDVGEVRHTMIDLNAGRVLFVVLVPDRDLKLGENYFALPPDALTLGSDQKHLVSNVTRESLASAPKFGRNDWAKLSSTAFASQVYRHYGKQAYFQGRESELQPTGRDDSHVYPNRDRNRDDDSFWDRDKDWDRNRDRDRDRDWDRDRGGQGGAWDSDRDQDRYWDSGRSPSSGSQNRE